jgi:uncharacterized protein (TIGR02680 family)
MTATLSAVPDRPAPPGPRADRWLPTRAGLMSVWRYVEETFEFHRGRLLLRGPNGSGKSMALELLLPFLLDADTSPNRLTSAAKSRGGLFDRVMTGADEPSRTGYAWVEFRRGRDAFTIGARMRASQSTRKVDVDYFTTTQVVGEDLHLLDGQRVPLSLKALKEALGDRGRVHGTAEEHRNAVRETLYEGFGPDRYASVVTALLALRKEKLSQNLDLDKLSEVMSEALPPIDEHDIAAVAEGFERLDRRRDQLDGLRGDLREVDALVHRQRAYARHVVAWLADEVRAAESRRDTVTRTAREAAERFAAEQERLRDAVERVAELARRIREARVRADGYRDSEAFREGARLVELRGQLRERRGERDDSEGRVAAAEARLARAREAVEEAAAGLEAAEGNLAHAHQALGRSALATGSGAVVEEATALADPSTDGDGAERLVTAHVTARRQAISEVRGVLAEHERARHQRDLRAETVEDALAALDDAVEAARAAGARLEAAVAGHVAAVERWVEQCRHVPEARLRSALPGDVADPDRVTAALVRLRSDLLVDHDRSVGDIVRRQRGLDDAHAELVTERQLYAAGSLVEPDPPPWRDDRSGEPGAPLWRAVDVAEGISAPVLDGVEAALAAAGLIDAWARPDGSVDLGRSDVTLVPAPLDGATLRSVLVPLDAHGLAADLVDRVLRSIRLVDTVGRDADRAGAERVGAAGAPGEAGSPGSAVEVAIGRDGTFRLGAAVGRGAVGPAELLGAEARERHRLARLAELDGLIAANRHEHHELGAARGALVRAWEATVAELDTAPAGDGVRAAQRDHDTALVREDERRRQWKAQRERFGEAEQRVRDALRRLTAEAARHGVPSDAGALDELARAIDALERAVGAWARRWRERRAALVSVGREREGLDAATAAHAADREADARIGRTVEDLAARVQAVEAALGSSYDEILRRIDELDRRREADKQQRDDLAAARPGIERLIGGLETSLRQAEADRAAAEDHRAAVHRRFAAAVGRGVARDADLAVPGELEGVTAVLTAARDLATSLGQVDTGQPARDRASSRVEEQLHLTRRRLTGYDLERSPTDDGWIDLTAGQGRRVGHLAEALRANLDSAAAELHDEEEQLFARVLAGDVRRSLAARIRHANDLVASINHQLEQVKTKAGGVQARLAWKVDDDQPDAVRSARALLLRDPSDLDAGETAALQAFVRARVEQARAELEANAPWEARLRDTLDYRRWHRFTLQITHRDWEGYQPATSRRLQKLSTGERSIALHLPMLASIAAHYTAADGGPAPCPRLILLDELFAGVDPANRAQLFARFTDWDLDAVFTSDHEWCQYATLDGIAIHHLHPPAGDEPVTSTRFTWDGRQRTIDPPAA